jgi:transposase-like protein
MQICPRCGSTRVRHGYGRERFGLRLIGVRELLCNHCNLSFTRFVLPGMMPKSSHRSKKRGNHEAKDATAPASEQSTIPVSKQSTAPVSEQSTGPVSEQSTAPVSEQSNGKRHRPRNRHSKQCPRCDGKNVHRSSRRGIREHAISIFSLYPYRCHDCDKRFYVRRAA